MRIHSLLVPKLVRGHAAKILRSTRIASKCQFALKVVNVDDMLAKKDGLLVLKSEISARKELPHHEFLAIICTVFLMTN